MKVVISLLVAVCAIVAGIGVVKFILDKKDQDEYNTQLKS